MSYQAPGAMLQFGWMAELTWGAYLALLSSIGLAIAARGAAKLNHRTLA